MTPFLKTLAILGVALPRILVAQEQYAVLTPQAAQSAYTALATTPISTGPLATPVTLDLKGRPLSAVLMAIVREARVSFSIDASQPGMEVRRDLRVTQMPARDALLRALQGTPFTALVGARGQIVITRTTGADSRPQAASQPGPRFRLSGYVRSLASREVVRRAQITADNETIRVESNEDGFYSILLAPGAHRIRIRAIGFAPADSTVNLTTNIAKDWLLDSRKVTLAAVTVQADRKPDDRPDLDPRTPDMSVIRLDLQAVKLLPPVLGEPDPVRSLTLLPGVSLSSDASTSFSVRGGAADQNLFLLDEATIYNPSHVLGFLSTFNTDAVDNVTLYKGAIPAKFGGRLSSVVDVRQREGNANEFQGSASIGLLASRFALEGPLPSKVGSYMFAARRSYADQFVRFSSDSNVRNARAAFYDINAKTNFRLGTSGSLLLSGYFGRDNFGSNSAESVSAGWGNNAFTLRWNQAIGGRLFSKLTTAYGNYDYRLDIPLGSRDSIVWTSRIKSLDIKLDETYYVSPNNTIEFGLQLQDQEFRPGTLTPRGKGTVIKRTEVSPRFGVSPAAYIGQDLKFGGDRFALRYGLRYAGFIREGRATIYKYANNSPVVFNSALGRYEPGVATDSTIYTAGQRVKSFGGFEPRISGRVMLTDESSLKASYARTQQFLLLATKTNSVTPLDVWEPVGPYVKPQIADQYAVGYSRTTSDFELSAEVYYKRAQNLVDFIDGADVVLNPRVETLLLQGNGRAYGLELFARRSTGAVTGWISYTLGRSEQRFPLPAGQSGALGGGINGGRYYPGPFDKTHNLSVVAIRPLGKKWTLGATFSLASGLPATFPSARYVLDGQIIADYATRNSARLPMYHRLDLSATRTYKHGELQFGILNAYNRFNAQALRFRQQVGNPLRTEAVQTSIFGIVPSVSYVFHF
jgi:hypothetical protein